MIYPQKQVNPVKFEKKSLDFAVVLSKKLCQSDHIVKETEEIKFSGNDSH